ncbi:MAG: hypothetical protein HYT82_01980 [Candidatus Harrisonbacteria bacterium]|nr:hypothetical protein [Candidatus Harrisonbacteria bacterium]
MRSIKIEKHVQNLRLTDRQRAIVVGLLLGDGHLETQNGGRTYRLKVEHGIAQKTYADWLYREFSDWVRTPPKERAKHSFGKPIVSYGFTTYASGALRFYGQQFYKERKKIMPDGIGNMLSPLALAVWFMDDGSWKSDNHRTYIIHTLGYSRKELERIQQVLTKNFGIAAAIHSQYNGLRLYIATASAGTFKELIGPYVIPSMKYKLGEQMPKK